jgi:hypothetical protein
MFRRDERKVKIEIWVEDREQAEAIADALQDAENEEKLDFAFDFSIYEDYE